MKTNTLPAFMPPPRPAFNPDTGEAARAACKEVGATSPEAYAAAYKAYGETFAATAICPASAAYDAAKQAAKPFVQPPAPPAPVALACLWGNATLFPGRHGALILTGKRTRPDSIFWSLYGEREGVAMAVSVQGLYRGRYADAIVSAQVLFDGLRAVGDKDGAQSLANACAANGVTLTC